MSFDTETMAELHATQGRVREALDIYRRLAAAAPDAATRARRQRRIAELERGAGALDESDAAGGDAPTEAPSGSPRIDLQRQGERVSIQWMLPGQDAAASEIELLLILRTPAGVTADHRTLTAARPGGRVVVEAAGLHSARAALGLRTDHGFVPVARATLERPIS